MRPAAFLTASMGLIAPLLMVSGGASHAADDPPTAPTIVDGVTAPVFEYADAIRETVWVTAPDLDGDGAQERIATDIIRPRELDGTARIPVVMDASPYYLSLGRGNDSEFKSYDADGKPAKMPLFYDNYFVPRGYAFVAPDMAGTGRSTGCADQGGRSDIESIKVVIEWLNGNAVARNAAGEVVEATWSNGRTGMIGKSYDGTLANGVAATGVEGLETIVPISAISSWYDYNRYQNAVKSNNYPSSLSTTIAQRRTVPTNCVAANAFMNANDGDETGAYTDFWAERDYREGSFYDVSKVKASVFIMHGLQDNNVRMRNASTWWQDLGEAGVDRKMWLTRLGHVDPFDSDRDRWVDTLHRWFDHELMQVDNGILNEPAVDVEVAPDRWVQSDVWPSKGSRMMKLALRSARHHAPGHQGRHHAQLRQLGRAQRGQRRADRGQPEQAAVPDRHHQERGPDLGHPHRRPRGHPGPPGRAALGAARRLRRDGPCAHDQRRRPDPHDRELLGRLDRRRRRLLPRRDPPGRAHRAAGPRPRLDPPRR